jgi:hypothetical protein
VIRVYVGTDGDIHDKAEKVLEYSIRKNSSTPDVEVNFMRPGWKSGCTGFTNHRFLIPWICGFEGYAIYMDVDMLVRGDIAELYSYREPGMWCTTPMRDDVSVIDCAAFGDLTTGVVRGLKKDRIRQLIADRTMVTIPKEWNTIDRLEPGAKLLHYSDLDRQPWHPIPGHPYKPHPDPLAVELFWNYYNEAIK